MKKVFLLVSVLLVLGITGLSVAGCKKPNNTGVKGENSTDVQIDVNDIFGGSETSGSDESSGQGSSSTNSSSSGSSSSSGDTSNSQSVSSDSSIDYEDPNVWTDPVKIPAKTS